MRTYTTTKILLFLLTINGTANLFSAAGPVKFKAKKVQAYCPLDIALIAEAAFHSELSADEILTPRNPRSEAKFCRYSHDEIIVRESKKVEYPKYGGSVKLMFFFGRRSSKSESLDNFVGISSDIPAKSLETGKVPKEIRSSVGDIIVRYMRRHPYSRIICVAGYKMGGTIASQTIADRRSHLPHVRVVTFNAASVISMYNSLVKEGSLQCHFMTSDCPKVWKENHYLITNDINTRGLMASGLTDYDRYLREWQGPKFDSLVMKEVLKCLVDERGSKLWEELLQRSPYLVRFPEPAASTELRTYEGRPPLGSLPDFRMRSSGTEDLGLDDPVEGCAVSFLSPHAGRDSEYAREADAVEREYAHGSRIRKMREQKERDRDAERQREREGR